MRQSFFVKDTAGAVACEQASVRGKKIARRGKGKGERGLFAFPFSSVPRGSTEGLFTDCRRCDLIRCVSTPLWLEV